MRSPGAGFTRNPHYARRPFWYLFASSSTPAGILQGDRLVPFCRSRMRTWSKLWYLAFRWIGTEIVGDGGDQVR